MDGTEATTEAMTEETSEAAAAEETQKYREVADRTDEDLRRVLDDVKLPSTGTRAEMVRRVCETLDIDWRRMENTRTAEEIAAMTCKALQAVLADLGMPTKGNKAELVGRLCERFDLEPPPKAEREVKYAFPTQSRCPRCGVTDTEATSTKGDRQYRKCRRAVCRKTYVVEGTAV